MPIGYDMPMPNDAGRQFDAAGEQAMHPRLGFSEGTDYYNTGKMGGNWGTGIPLEVTADVLRRGEQRFNINCAVCHGPLANGDGIAKSYGLATVVSLQDDRIRNMADGEIFNTITHGKNTMMAYGPRVMVQDRWAIICYLRTLQRSQHAAAADVPPDHVADLEAKPEPAKPATRRNQRRRRRNERSIPRHACAGRRVFRDEAALPACRSSAARSASSASS